MVLDTNDYKLDETKLHQITRTFLEQEYNVSFNKTEQNIWKGISYFGDILFCFPLNYYITNSPIASTFICRPSSKINFLSLDTIKQLGIHETSSSFVVYIAGIKTVVYSSRFSPNNEDINIIGHDFLSSFDCNLILEYKDSQCYPHIAKLNNEKI